MRTTVTIDDQLFVQVMEVAVRSNRSLSAVVEDALRESLARCGQTQEPVRIPVGGNADDKPLVDILDRGSARRRTCVTAPVCGGR